jgi:hypothetical protein
MTRRRQLAQQIVNGPVGVNAPVTCAVPDGEHVPPEAVAPSSFAEPLVPAHRAVMHEPPGLTVRFALPPQLAVEKMSTEHEPPQLHEAPAGASHVHEPPHARVSCSFPS